MSPIIFLAGGLVVVLVGLILFVMVGHERSKALPMFVILIGAGVAGFGVYQAAQQNGGGENPQVAQASPNQASPSPKGPEEMQYYSYLATFKDNSLDNNEEGRKGLLSLGTKVIPELITIITTDAHMRAREECTNVLARFGEPAIEPLVTAMREKSEFGKFHVPKALGKIGAPAVPVLLQEAASEDPYIRDQAVEALSMTNLENAAKGLLDILAKTDDTEFQKELIKGLGKIGSPVAVDPLLKRLDETDDTAMQVTIIDALGTLNDEKVVKVLLKYLNPKKYPEYQIRKAAATSLGNTQSKKALKELKETLTDDHKDVRAASAYALGRIGDKDSMWAIQKQMEKETAPFVKRMMQNTIQQLNQLEN